jgi:hypothetical protein
MQLISHHVTWSRSLSMLFVFGALLADTWTSAGAISKAWYDDDDKPTQALWRNPEPIALRDVYWGGGSQERMPAPPFAFVQEDTSGTKPKVDVIDASGMKWRVKFSGTSSTGKEVHAEIASARLMWALGYLVEEQYYVAEGRIDGASSLGRAREAIGTDGGFRSARFERRPAEITREGRWEFDRNPFLGTAQLSGLKILVMLLANWDARSGNTAVLRIPLSDGRAEEWYILSDTGTAFGRMSGGFLRHPSRWHLEDYAGQRFIRRVVGERVEFRYATLGIQDATVPLKHAQWFEQLISQLRPEQVRQAFEAAGASAAEIEGFSEAVLGRIREFQDAVRGNSE